MTENAWTEWQACAEALALPTADHLPDAGRMVVDHFPDATKMIETAAPGCELPELPEPDPMADRWLSSHIYTADQMRAYARAAQSAGDAVDAQRYRWLRDESYSDIWDFGGCYPRTGLDAAIDAAIRALKD
jgi:hypothetical protein